MKGQEVWRAAFHRVANNWNHVMTEHFNIVLKCIFAPWILELSYSRYLFPSKLPYLKNRDKETIKLDK